MLAQANGDPLAAMEILSSAGIEPAAVSKVKTPIVHLCQECEREFSTVQALNAHKRFCAGRLPERTDGQST
jgi:hypothetical protein